jgi:hypothetical protein
MSVAPAPLPGRRAATGGRLPWIVAVVVLSLAVVVLIVRQDHGSSSSPSLQGSGTPASQTRVLSAFHRVELAGASNVVVSAGARQSVVVSADDNLLDRVTTRVGSGTLVIGSIGSFETRVPMSVRVTVPTLDAVTLSGSGMVAAEGIDAAALRMTLSGSGLLRASGTVDHLDVVLGGSGDAELGGLQARDARAVVTGSGRIVVYVTGALDASVPGSGAVLYRGSPAHVTTMVTGSGAVVPG